MFEKAPEGFHYEYKVTWQTITAVVIAPWNADIGSDFQLRDKITGKVISCILKPNNSLTNTYTQPCPICHGKGVQIDQFNHPRVISIQENENKE